MNTRRATPTPVGAPNLAGRPSMSIEKTGVGIELRPGDKFCAYRIQSYVIQILLKIEVISDHVIEESCLP